MNNFLGSSGNGNFGTNGGLAPGRMAPPLKTSPLKASSALPETSFIKRNTLARSAEFLRAKTRYEKMERIGTIGKDLQVATFAKLKQIERIELEKLNKKNKKNDIHQR